MEKQSRAKEYLREVIELGGRGISRQGTAKAMNHKTIEDVKEKTRKVQLMLKEVRDHCLSRTIINDTFTLLDQCQKELTELEKMKI